MEQPNAFKKDDEALRERSRSMLEPLAMGLNTSGSAAESTLTRALDEVEGRLLDVLREHEGMATELLRAYEQLGIVFEVTRKLMSLRREQDVVALFVESLQLTYSDAELAVVRASDGWESQCVQGAAAPIWMLAELEACAASSQIAVAHSDRQVGLADDGAPLFAESGLLAPVSCGGEVSYVILIWRSNNASMIEHFESVDMLLLDSLASFCGDLIRNFRLVEELQEMAMDTVRTLVSAVDQKDPYTSGHSNRVGYYAKLLALEIGYEEEDLRALEWSALLHDVGKIGIRDDVLKKEGKLTDQEFDHIKEHPMRGYLVLRENPRMRDVLDGVLHHHERWDGKGYPDGLKGEEIPLQARIIQIADIFDALTTTRSYRSKFDWRKALSILEEEAGTVGDPRLGATFAALLRRLESLYPKAFEDIGKLGVTLCLTGSPVVSS